MKGKKQIDELFKERFKNFEATPSSHVWDAIQATLKKEEDDRKVIPIWWKLGGVAALLAILLTVGSIVFNPFDTTKNITSEDAIPLDLPEMKKDLINSDYINKNEIASEEIENPSTKESSEVVSEIDLVTSSDKEGDPLNISNTKQDAVIAESTSNKVSNSKKEKTNSILKQNPPLEVISEKERIAVVTKKETSEEVVISKPNDGVIKKDITLDETAKPIANETNDSDINKEGKATDAKTKDDVIKSEEGLNKRSLLDVIKENKVEKAVAKASNIPDERWDVAPNFAPVYYNSLSEGSSIDPSFSDNAKSGGVNLSYGVQVSYAINNRLSVRSGISNVDLSYATSELELGTAPVSEALKSIDYGERQVVTTAVDKGTFSNNPPGGNPFGNITPKSTSGDVKLVQDINYYEIPLELKYAVLDSKFGVNIIGGLSTMLLGKNEVYVQADGFEEALGNATNLSSISFSTNLGVGFDYKITRKLRFNLEPMFKYQLNPYTDSSVNFKPYYIGVYTGLSLKF